jgi:hypothetical protein
MHLLNTDLWNADEADFYGLSRIFFLILSLEI